MSFKETLLMPSTSFEMRGNLTQKEPVLIEKWEKMDLYHKMNEDRPDVNSFILHDGPPYANGDIHCGHMLNRLLKDFIIRFKNMEGYKTPFVFGWDTHGLPIEVKVTKSGVNRKKMPVSEFRDLCKQYALKQVDHQKAQIRRLGCLGDYDHPYMTLQKEYEARQIDVFAKMAMDGLIYKGVKPVYWSPSSESALAEAEVEYKDIGAKTLYVAFSFVDSKGLLPEGSSLIVWTTTPWTVPADLAVTLNPRFEYGLFETEKGKFLFLASLKEKLQAELGFEKCELIKSYKGSELEGCLLAHPLYEGRTSMLINASFVTDTDGTGCVHTAPDHGVDDFNACLKYGIKPFCPVDERGYFHLDEKDPCNGKFYEEANDIVIEELKANGHLLKEVDIVHSYPHDWRTHKPVIFRATPQWFCSIEPIRAKLLETIHSIKWEPAWGETKMVNMIKDRNDWCISRQRAWGVPLPIIYNEDDTPIIDEAVFKHIRDLFAENGSNCWFTMSEKELLPEGYASSHSPNGKFRKETDIMDVWFDSGSSWNGVLRERELPYPADLYLEGNDQYRGWFNSSLILSLAYSGKAPFKSCLTHGWVMDDNWQKMSKSAGNGIDPSKVASQYGADILRLWAASVNYEADVRISESIIQTVSEQYRKIRNTFKFLLGNLQDGNGKAYAVPEVAPELWPLDKWVLFKEEKLKNEVLDDFDSYSFASANSSLMSFLVDISSYYLDFAKDALYCEKADSKRRKAIQYVIYKIANDLCLLYNPILPFTMDEVYKNIPGKTLASPQLDKMPERSHVYSDEENRVSFLALRDETLKALESGRADGLYGASLEAILDVSIDNKDLYTLLSSLQEEELDRMFGVSEVNLSFGEKSIKVAKFEDGVRCDRCRRLTKDGVDTEEGHLCKRCLTTIKGE